MTGLDQYDSLAVVVGFLGAIGQRELRRRSEIPDTNHEIRTKEGFQSQPMLIGITVNVAGILRGHRWPLKRKTVIQSSEEILVESVKWVGRNGEQFTVFDYGDLRVTWRQDSALYRACV